MNETSWINCSSVAVAKSEKNCYPQVSPFHPSEKFPEFSSFPDFLPDKENHVFSAVREALALITETNPGDFGWNPFSNLIQTGDTVVLKPNFIKECHETKPDEWEQVITHGSIIRAVCDYVLLALNGTGKVIICDAPQTDSSFDKICRVSGAKNVVDWYNSWSKTPVELLDLRKEEWQSANDVIIKRQKLPGDPAGYVAVNLGKDSEFFGINPKHGFYGADYETKITHVHHHGDVHEYLLSGTVMNADVVINLPKLKTHKKTGITCALKNLVGINGDKNWLPHYILGSPEEGGDQFEKSSAKTFLERFLMTNIKRALFYSPSWLNHLFRPIKKAGKTVFGSTHKVIRSGNWHGNDTTWRMVVDLNKCFFYFAKGQKSKVESQNEVAVNQNSKFKNRKYFTLVDGIIGGEGEGPLAPSAKNCGVIICGFNPVAVDTASAWLMGFAPEKLRLLTGSFECRNLPLRSFSIEDILIRSNNEDWKGKLSDLENSSAFQFEPHFGWRGAIEQ